MAKKIALVACVSKKNSTPMPARDLYISDWFRKASAYAMRVADEWYILSAKHGLVAPDTVIEPYDETLNRMPATARRAWARQVVDDLGKLLQPGDQVMVLAGKRYRENLVNPIRQMGAVSKSPWKDSESASNCAGSSSNWSEIGYSNRSKNPQRTHRPRPGESGLGRQ